MPNIWDSIKLPVAGQPQDTNQTPLKAGGHDNSGILEWANSVKIPENKQIKARVPVNPNQSTPTPAVSPYKQFPNDLDTTIAGNLKKGSTYLDALKTGGQMMGGFLKQSLYDPFATPSELEKALPNKTVPEKILSTVSKPLARIGGGMVQGMGEQLAQIKFTREEADRVANDKNIARVGKQVLPKEIYAKIDKADLSEVADTIINSANVALPIAAAVTDFLSATGNKLATRTTNLRVEPEQIRAVLKSDVPIEPKARVVLEHLEKNNVGFNMSLERPAGGLRQSVGETIGGKPTTSTAFAVDQAKPQFAGATEPAPAPLTLAEKLKTNIPQETVAQPSTLRESLALVKQPEVPSLAPTLKDSLINRAYPENTAANQIAKVGGNLELSPEQKSLKLPELDKVAPSVVQVVGRDGTKKFYTVKPEDYVQMQGMIDTPSSNIVDKFTKDLSVHLTGISSGGYSKFLNNGLKYAGQLDVAGLEKMVKEQFDKTMAEKETSTALNAVTIPYVTEFIQSDVIPSTGKVFNVFKDTLNILRKTFAPTSLAKPAALDNIMKLLGERNKYDHVLQKSTEHIKDTFNKLGEEQSIAFIDKMKAGEAQDDPKLQAIAEFMAKIDAENWKLASQFNPDLAWKDNHFRVFWKKIPGTPEKESFFGIFRKPLQGTRGFMKHSTLASISEGIAKGGVPYSYNPMVLFQLAQADIMKYITAQKWFKDGKSRGSIVYRQIGQPLPEGKAPINDNIARTYLGGGSWVADEAEARLINNYLSRDIIRETELGKGLVYLKNATTALELSLSPFHAIFETVETIGSSVGLGLQKIFNQGNLLGGFKDIVTAPISPFTTARLGSSVINYIDKGDLVEEQWVQKLESQYPEIKQVIDDLFTGGAKLKMHEDYRNSSIQTFKENAGKGNYIGATLRALPAINELVMKPLFDYYIPRLKIGVFIKEYTNAIVENQAALEEGKVTRETLARKQWASVEDRFGEMNWDNLFWSRTFKTAMQIMFRSTTWKLGNLRASGGAFYGQTAEFVNAVKGLRRPRLHPKMAWFLGMSIVTAVIGTIIMKVFTGKYPKEMKDYLFPWVDDKVRVSVPSYWRDILSLKRSPSTYISHSLSGFIGKILETWENKDFYGNQVYNDRDPAWKQVLDAGANFIPKPFAISSALNTEGKDKAFGFFGFTKAPAYVTNTPIQNEIYDLYNKRFGGGIKSPAQTEKNDVYKEYKSLIKQGKEDEANQVLKGAVDKGIATTKGFNVVKANMSKGTDKLLFDRLPKDDKDYLINKMSGEEKSYYTAKTTSKKSKAPTRSSSGIKRLGR